MNWQRIRQHRWTVKVIEIFSQGLAPKPLAMSIILGVGIGVIPLVGVATPIVGFLAISLRLNLPIAIFMTYAVSPLHVLLFIPFIYVGEWITGMAHSPISFGGMKEAFQLDFFGAMGDLTMQIGCGIVGWLVLGVPVAMGLFFILYAVLALFMNREVSEE